MPPQHGKPVADSSLVLMADGSRRRIDQVKVGDWVISGRGVAREVLGVHVQGELECVKITAHSGRSTVAALGHPFLTTEGWVNAGELSELDYLANVPRPQTEENFRYSKEEFRLAGYFVGDGATSGNHCNITCADPDSVEDIKRLAAALGFEVTFRPKYAYHLKGGAREWLEATGLRGKTAHTKTVPEWVFRGSNENIAHFLASYFLCDGSINSKGTKRHDPCSEFYSVSRELLEGIQHLLLRFGIRSKLSVKNGLYKGKNHVSNRLSITSRSDMAKLVRQIPLIGYKKNRCDEWKLRDTDFEAPLLSDKVVSVEPAGKVSCRCLTVAVDHTFTSDDFVVHNSELISRYFPPWHLGSFPDKRLALISYGTDYAETWGGRARDNFEAWGEDVFGITVKKTKRAQGDWELEGHRGGLFATGIDGTITGRPVDGLIIDDPIKNAVEAFSTAKREKAKDFWLSVSKTRLAADAWWIVLQTRWHEDDLAGWLLGGQEKDVVVLNLPAISIDPAELPERERELYRGDPLGRAPGEALCPQLKPIEFLRDVAQNNDYFFSAMYQGRPVPVGGGMFSEGWFSFWDLRELPVDYDAEKDCYYYPKHNVKFDEIISSWDFPRKKTEHGSFMVGQVWGRIGTTRYLLDQVRERVEVEAMPAAVKAMLRRWPMIQGHIVEEKAAGPEVMKALRADGVENLIGYDPQGQSKEIRATSWTFAARGGHVKIPSFHLHPWVRDWLNEITSFPNWATDDQMDAASQAMINMRVASTTKVYTADCKTNYAALVRSYRKGRYG